MKKIYIAALMLLTPTLFAAPTVSVMTTIDTSSEWSGTFSWDTPDAGTATFGPDIFLGLPGSVGLTPGTLSLTDPDYNDGADVFETTVATTPNPLSVTRNTNPGLTDSLTVIYNNGGGGFTDVTGTLTVNFATRSGSFGFSSVPEPSSALCLGMIALACCGWRRLKLRK